MKAVMTHNLFSLMMSPEFWDRGEFEVIWLDFVKFGGKSCFHSSAVYSANTKSGDKRNIDKCSANQCNVNANKSSRVCFAEYRTSICASVTVFDVSAHMGPTFSEHLQLIFVFFPFNQMNVVVSTQQWLREKMWFVFTLQLLKCPRLSCEGWSVGSCLNPFPRVDLDSEWMYNRPVYCCMTSG